MIRIWSLVTATACGLLGSFGALAQTTGTILGLVSDPSGAAVVNAAVEAQNLGTGLARKAVTNDTGTYLIPSLPPGTYKISVTAPGFKVFTESGIGLEVDQNARV